MTKVLLASSLACLTLAACGKVAINDGGARRDAAPDGVAPDRSADLPVAEAAPDLAAPDLPVDLPVADAAPDLTASDLAAPDLERDTPAPDVSSDLLSETVTCSGPNPAAPTCRNGANDCIPSQCGCGANGLWMCTADCRLSLPLCTDAGPADTSSDVYVRPTDEQSCLKAANVPSCDAVPPHATIRSAASGPLLAKVEVQGGTCTAAACSSGCASIEVTATTAASVGTACALLVTATDGRTQSVPLSLVANPSPTSMCCGYPTDGHGVWSAIDLMVFQPGTVVVAFGVDGGATDAEPDPCAKCAATEACVQLFDGVCHLGSIVCRTVSAACKRSLGLTSVRSCASFPECENEICGSPYRCTNVSPCGTESPSPEMVCYGP
jgi:hypothetical protein